MAFNHAGKDLKDMDFLEFYKAIHDQYIEELWPYQHVQTWHDKKNAIFDRIFVCKSRKV